MLRGAGRALAVAIALAAAVFWFGLGMHRGLLLSEDIKSRCWPWAPYAARPQTAAPALSDPVWQFVPWLELARREIRDGRLPLWNPYQDGGVPLLGNAQSALGSPLVWPVLAAGAGVGWNVSLLLRLIVAFAGAWLWLRDLGRSPVACALGAVAFSASGPFVAWLEHPQTLTAAAAPFLLLCTRRAALQPTRGNVLGLALSAYVVMAGGHPETQLMIALLAVAVAVRTARGAAALAWPVAGALLGAGLAAPLTFPFVEYFLLSEARFGVDRQPFVLPVSDLLRFVGRGAAGSNVIEAAATVSVTVLLLAIAGVLGWRRDRDTVFWGAIAAGILLVTYDNPCSRFLAVHTPIHWSRALLLLPLSLAFLASRAVDEAAARFRSARWRRMALAIGPAALVVAACELLAAAQGVHGSTPPSELARSTPLLDALVADRGVFRVLPLHTFLPPNAATDYGLEDLRGYDALTPRGWRSQWSAIGRSINVPTQSGVLEPWDLAAGGAALDFWNVKYLLLHPQFEFGADEFNAKKGLDLEEVYSGPDGRLLRNRRVQDRARLSGAGRVKIETSSPLRWQIHVEAAEQSVLTVANPMFPGWRAKLDGHPVELAMPPGDPIRLRVAPGRHEVELQYGPWSFRAGCLVALSAALALVVVARHLPDVAGSQ